MPRKVALKAIACLLLAAWCMMAAPFATGETIQYFYDELNRLEEVRYPDGTVVRYSYDAAGNRIARYATTADLVPTVITGPASAGTQEPVTVTTTVRNQGQSESGPFRVGIYLSADNTITVGDRYLGESPVSNLGAGSQTALNVTVQVPSDVIPGDYFWGAIADYANEALEFDEQNNALAGNAVSIALPPDLFPQAVSGPGLATQGQPVPVAGTVRNGGSGASPAFAVGIYLSSDNTITTGDILVGQVPVGPLAPGGQQPFSATVTIPSGTADGAYSWGAIADDPGAVWESNEGNNALSGNGITLMRDAIRASGTPPTYYLSLQAAYDAAADGEVIQCLGIHVTENLVANRAIGVVVEGGYDAGFEVPTGSTVLHGSLAVTAGTVTIRDVRLAP